MFSFVLIHSFASTLFCFTSCFLHALRFSLLNFFSCISFCFAWFFSLLPLLFYDCLSRPFPFVCLPSFPAPFLLFYSLLFVHTVLLYLFRFRGCCYVPVVFFPPTHHNNRLERLETLLPIRRQSFRHSSAFPLRIPVCRSRAISAIPLY